MLVGGDGRRTGVPKHIEHLVSALQSRAKLSIISDIDEGGYDFASRTAATLIQIAGISSPRRPIAVARAMTRMIQILKADPPDLIWCHARLPSLLLRMALTLKILQIPTRIAMTYHGLPFAAGRPGALNRLAWAMETALLRFGPSQHLVFLDDRSRDRFRRQVSRGIFSWHETHVLTNCSSLRPFPRKRRKGRRHLVMTSRADPQKDLGFAVELMRHLPSKYRLTLSGPGTDHPAFRRRLGKIVPQDTLSRISCMGTLADVRPLLQTADAYLVTSLYEGTPIGTLEAFEAGLPVILRHFDGADALISAHPCSLLIGKQSLRRTAQNIEKMLKRAEERDLTLAAQTRAVWAQRWAPAIFDANVREFVSALLGSTSSAHDGPVPHPDHRRNEAVPLPVSPPRHTGVSPSAASG